MNITIPDMKDGERYAGIAIDPDSKPTHHLILLPQQPDTHLDWDDAMAWAAEIGATIPTRREQSLLFANCMDAFESDWYWSSEQDAGYSSNAWFQGFVDGNQYNCDKSYKGRVCAVRRVAIEVEK